MNDHYWQLRNCLLNACTLLSSKIQLFSQSFSLRIWGICFFLSIFMFFLCIERKVLLNMRSRVSWVSFKAFSSCLVFLSFLATHILGLLALLWKFSLTFNLFCGSTCALSYPLDSTTYSWFLFCCCTISFFRCLYQILSTFLVSLSSLFSW